MKVAELPNVFTSFRKVSRDAEICVPGMDGKRNLTHLPLPVICECSKSKGWETR